MLRYPKSDCAQKIFNVLKTAEGGLDAGLVKAYAADYCGTATLRDAGRDLVEAFINDLAERAAKDRPGLICQLNSYAKPQEVAP